MSKPLTFHFSYGLEETPRVLVVVDLLADCSKCGYTEIQRFFHGVAYHSLNPLRLAAVVAELPTLLGYRCGQCDEDVRPEDCRNGALNYPFSDGAGSLGAVFGCERGRPVDVRYWVQGGKRLDAQALPTWEPPVNAHLVTDVLSEDDVFEHTGRVMQPKGAWRALLRDALSEGEGQVEPVAAGFWIAAGASDDEVDEVVQEDPALAEALDRGALDMVALHGSMPELTWKRGSYVRGAPDEWMPQDVAHALVEEQLVAYAFVSAERCLDALTATLRAGRLEFAVSDAGPDTWITDVATPRGEVYEPELAMSAIVSFAVRTGMTPGEAGRFVGEHVVASLLGLEL